jgi:hypothetical protein
LTSRGTLAPATVLTRNLREFGQVPGLVAEAALLITALAACGTPDPGAHPDAGAPDAIACFAPSSASVGVHLAGPTLGTLGCDGATLPGTPDPIVTSLGAVVETHDDATGSHLTLDLCSPAGGCAPTRDTLTIAAAGFTFAGNQALRAGQFVSLRTRITRVWGCTVQVELSNLMTWDGHPNPIRNDSALLAAAADGEAQALPDAPIMVSRHTTGCRATGSDCGGGPPEVFALTFVGKSVGSVPVTAEQRAEAHLIVDGHPYVGYDARAYNSGACDDYWNYAWTLRESP